MWLSFLEAAGALQPPPVPAPLAHSLRSGPGFDLEKLVSGACGRPTQRAVLRTLCPAALATRQHGGSHPPVQAIAFMALATRQHGDWQPPVQAIVSTVHSPVHTDVCAQVGGALHPPWRPHSTAGQPPGSHAASGAGHDSTAAAGAPGAAGPTPAAPTGDAAGAGPVSSAAEPLGVRAHSVVARVGAWARRAVVRAWRAVAAVFARDPMRPGALPAPQERARVVAEAQRLRAEGERVCGGGQGVCGGSVIWGVHGICSAAQHSRRC